MVHSPDFLVKEKYPKPWRLFLAFGLIGFAILATLFLVLSSKGDGDRDPVSQDERPVGPIEAVQGIADRAKLVRRLLGYGARSRSLILLLNNAELRPGGGFIGTVGLLEMENARVALLEVTDAYAIDQPAEAFLNIAPPDPLKQYLGLNRWFMRDANWSPDFHRSASTVLDFYEQERGQSRGEPVDFVIGVTTSFGSQLLELTGPIVVDGKTFTSANLFDLLEYEVERGFTVKEERKRIFGHLIGEVLHRIENLPLGQWDDLIRLMENGFREKQLMLYSRDISLQSQIERLEWDGRMETGEGDFLMVVDANLGSLKSDPVVKRFISYHLEPEDDTYRATVSIKYRHEGSFDWKTTRYRTYTRAYVPEGSEFISAEGALKDDKIKNPAREPGEVDVTSELGATVFGAFTAIEPGEERVLSFSYRLPPGVRQAVDEQKMYSLKVQKQLGAADHDLTLDLDFGKRVEKLRTDLRQDRMYTISLQ